MMRFALYNKKVTVLYLICIHMCLFTRRFVDCLIRQMHLDYLLWNKRIPCCHFSYARALCHSVYCVRRFVELWLSIQVKRQSAVTVCINHIFKRQLSTNQISCIVKFGCTRSISVNTVIARWRVARLRHHCYLFWYFTFCTGWFCVFACVEL